MSIPFNSQEMLIRESFMTSLKLNLKTRTSSSPSLPCQSIPEVTLLFLESCSSLASSYFSTSSFSMDLGEYFSSYSQALCRSHRALYSLCCMVSWSHLLWDNLTDTNPGPAPVIATHRSSPLLHLLSSIWSRNPACVWYTFITDVSSSSECPSLLLLADHHSDLSFGSYL